MLPSNGADPPCGERQILAAVMENTRALLAYLDPQFNFVLANSAYVASSGYTWDELVGRNHFDLFPDPSNRALFERARDSGEPIALYNKPFEYVNQPERGVTYWDWTFTPLKDPAGHLTGFVLSLVDTTSNVRIAQEHAAAIAEMERLRAEAERRNIELTGLLEISRDVASSLQFEEILGHILDHLRPVVQPRGTGIFMEQGEEITALLYRSDQPDKPAYWMNTTHVQAPLVSEVFRRCETIIVDDLNDDGELATLWRSRVAGANRASLEGSRSWLGIPLEVKGKVVGVLRVNHSDPGYFTPRLVRLAQSIAHQAAIAIEHARLYQEAQRAAAYDERQRLARELHDSISQSLYGIALGTHSARKLLNDKPARVGEALDYVLSLAESAVAEMRALIFELRPESLEREGLSGALTYQAAAANARYRYEVQRELEEEGELPPESQYALYRIAQEALNNAGRHGRPTHVILRLLSKADYVTLEVIDDGLGFDAEREYPGHLGLKSMRERALAIGASISVLSKPGCGATVRVDAPRIPHR